MNNPLISILKTQGIAPFIFGIDRSVRDLKALEYTREEIKETLDDKFRGLDSRIDSYLTSKGY